MLDSEQTNDNRSLIPWIESSILLGGILVAAVATSAISLYRIDDIDNKLDSVAEKVDKIGYLQYEVNNLKANNREIVIVFGKIADSVDRLAIAVAKLEEREDGKERGK